MSDARRVKPGDLSISCLTGEHSKCSGEPPSEALRKFLPPELRDARCACPYHRDGGEER